MSFSSLSCENVSFKNKRRKRTQAKQLQPRFASASASASEVASRHGSQHDVRALRGRRCSIVIAYIESLYYNLYQNSNEVN